jgi:hypothetical protein
MRVNSVRTAAAVSLAALLASASVALAAPTGYVGFTVRPQVVSAAAGAVPTTSVPAAAPATAPAPADDPWD